MDWKFLLNFLVTFGFLLFAGFTYRETRRQRELQQAPSIFVTLTKHERWCTLKLKTKHKWLSAPQLINLAPNGVAILSTKLIRGEEKIPLNLTKNEDHFPILSPPVVLQPGERAVVDPCYANWQPGENHVEIHFVYGPNATLYRLDVWLLVEAVNDAYTFKWSEQTICRVDDIWPMPRCSK